MSQFLNHGPPFTKRTTNISYDPSGSGPSRVRKSQGTGKGLPPGEGPVLAGLITLRTARKLLSGEGHEGVCCANIPHGPIKEDFSLLLFITLVTPQDSTSEK